MKKELQFQSFMDLLWHSVMVAKWDQETTEKIIMIYWKLWTYRNEVRNGGVRKNERAIIKGALDYLGEYQSCVAVMTRQEKKRPAVWSPLPTNLYKINVDGAVFIAQRVAGMGVLIRDESGNVIKACSKKILAPLGTIEVEAKVIKLAVQFAKVLLIQDFIVESDSLTLINALKESSPPPIAIAALVYSSLAASHEFRRVEFNHVGRQGNRPAHLLAKHACGIEYFSVWIEETPCFIEQALLHDVSLAFKLI